MHEMGIVVQIVDIVTERPASAQHDRVARVELVIGKLSAVSPAAIAFAWDVAIEGTLLAGALLTIVEKDGLAKCRACNAEVVLVRPIGVCACGGTDLEYLEGDELHIRAVDYASTEALVSTNTLPENERV